MRVGDRSTEVLLTLSPGEARVRERSWERELWGQSNL